MLDKIYQWSCFFTGRMQYLMHHCGIKSKSTGKRIFFQDFHSGRATVLQDFICVQVAVRVIGIQTIQIIVRAYVSQYEAECCALNVTGE